MPVATALNVAVAPSSTDAFAGCVVMAGGTSTLSVAALEVAVPTEFVTTTRNVAPSSAAVVAGVVYVAPVAPAMSVVPRCHW